MVAEFIGSMIVVAHKENDTSSIIPVLHAIEAIAASDDLNAIDLVEAGLVEGMIRYADEYSIDTTVLYQSLGQKTREQWGWIRNVWIDRKTSIAPSERQPPHRRVTK